jgi:hypothetical protein
MGRFLGKNTVKGIDNDQDVNYYRRGSAQTSYLLLGRSGYGYSQAYTALIVGEEPEASRMIKDSRRLNWSHRTDQGGQRNQGKELNRVTAWQMSASYQQAGVGSVEIRIRL